jgi:hypothetical protein
VGEVASSNLVVPTIIFSELDQPMRVDGSNLGSAEVQYSQFMRQRSHLHIPKTLLQFLPEPSSCPL